MEANTILTATLLDILFEGKNKDYGAYDLRKTYNKRISVSLVITIILIAIILITTAITTKNSGKNIIQIPVTGIVIQPSTAEPIPPPPPILPPPPAPPVATAGYTTPLVVKDPDVIKPPPEIAELTNAKIDFKTKDGVKDAGFTNPPEDIKGTQTIAPPRVKKNDTDSTFYTVEIEATFPGGANAWSKYVGSSIQKDLDEFTESDYGKCIVKFIVDKAGKVSDVEAITMKGTKLAEIATHAIMKGPDWIPAQQNGHYVKAVRLQPVTLNRPGE